MERTRNLEVANPHPLTKRLAPAGDKRSVGVGDTSSRLFELRSCIVARLEAANESADWPEYWRIQDGVVQVGREHPALTGQRWATVDIDWQDVPFLSVVLCERMRDRRFAEFHGIPF